MDSRALSIALLLLLSLAHCIAAEHSEARLYIAYLGERQHDDPDLVTESHHDMLTSLLGSKKKALESIVYSYKHGFSGFAAMLTEAQAKQLSETLGVISVKPNRLHKMHTTRSWDFLELPRRPHESSLLQKAKYGEDIIIGVLDTGVWPESRSFDDTGFGPIPSRWKGICQSGEKFNSSNCNRKLIGARWYPSGFPREVLKGEYMSPRDLAGHGTHTSSTAAGVAVYNASYHGIAGGIVRGGAPRARVAIYKVCWTSALMCADAPMLAAIDHAIHDGVDVLSLSLGAFSENPGTLYAVAKGITVVFSGGNDGPAPQTVEATVPWVISAAATTIDRSFPTYITLGSKEKLVGQGLVYESKKSVYKPIIFGSSCSNDSLANLNVTGKLVLCFDPTSAARVLPRQDIATAGKNVLQAGGFGIIYAMYISDVLDFVEQFEEEAGFLIVFVDYTVAYKIVSYTATAKSPVAKLSLSTTSVGEVWAPKVAAFSSRGPSVLFPSLLKPDIAAPGVSILAATGDSFKLDSGTSMACPHISGIVALLKRLHPEWSPAAIKSALVTTASTTDHYGLPIEANGTPRKIGDPFDYGGGFVNPDRAADPGLIYDIEAKEYLKFFNCHIVPNAQCDDTNETAPLYNLNLPSVAIPDLKYTRTIWRTVTNIGSVSATYKAFVEPPPGVKMTVEPSVLVFNAAKKMLNFKVTFTAIRTVQADYAFGSLTWTDGEHQVRIPIAVRTIVYDYYADA